MKRVPEDDTLLRSYLLGELRDEEADGLERRLIQEDELFELAEAVEADLLAAVDRGDLAPAERERVLQRLASSPQGRERLALARSLNAEADKRVLIFRRRVPPPVIRWAALAACLLVLPSLGWLAWHLRDKAQDAPTHVTVPTPTPGLTKHAPVVTPVPRPANPPIATLPKTAPVEPLRPAADVLTLTLMSLRGADEEVAKLRLSPGSHMAVLQIDTNGDARPFDVVIHRDERTIWEKSALKPTEMNGGPVLVVHLPAEILSAGRYEIAVTAEGESDEMSQEFQVVKRNH